MIRVELVDRTVRVHGGDVVPQINGMGFLVVTAQDDATILGVYQPGAWTAAMVLEDGQEQVATLAVPTPAMGHGRAESVVRSWEHGTGVELDDHQRSALSALLVEVAGSTDPRRLPRVGDHLAETDGARWDVLSTRYTQGPDCTRLVVEYVHPWPVVGQQTAEGPS